MRVGQAFERSLAPVVLLVVFAALALTGTGRSSFTYDEPVHLVSGLAYLERGDFRLNFEHPPLVKEIAALPLLARGDRLPSEDLPAWRDAVLDHSAQWRVAHETLFETAEQDPKAMLLAARLPMIGLGLLLGALVWLWARGMAGAAAAAVALTLYVFDPNMLAHAPLVATDLPLALLATATFFAAWRFMGTATLPSLAALGASFALAQATKFSALAFGPILVLVLAVRVLLPRPWPARWGGRAITLASIGPRALVALTACLVAALLSLTAVWAAYGARFAPTPEGALFPLDRFVEIGREKAAAGNRLRGLQAASLGFVLERELLPQAYVAGVIDAVGSARGRVAYLRGRIAEGGFRAYFPVAMLVKTPLPTLLIGLAGVVFGVAGLRREPRLAALLLPPAVILASAVASGLNIGLRHVLAVYPFLFVLGGLAIRRLLDARPRLARAALAGAGAWLIAGTLAAHPFELAYFNLVAGGPKRGAEWLVDSNLDWGQDLNRLAPWMRAHGVDVVNLCYFGTADPAAYGVEYACLPGGACFGSTRAPSFPGVVAVSATHRVGLYLSPEQRESCARLLAGARPLGTLGHSIELYWVERAP